MHPQRTPNVDNINNIGIQQVSRIGHWIEQWVKPTLLNDRLRVDLLPLFLLEFSPQVLSRDRAGIRTGILLLVVVVRAAAIAGLERLSFKRWLPG